MWCGLWQHVCRELQPNAEIISDNDNWKWMFSMQVENLELAVFIMCQDNSNNSLMNM